MIKGTKYKEWTLIEEHPTDKSRHRHYASLDIGKVFNIIALFEQDIWTVILQCKIAPGIEQVQLKPAPDVFKFLDEAEAWATDELIMHAQEQFKLYTQMGYRLI